MRCVITSYSIHYTKLYDIKKCFDILVDIKYHGVVSIECEGQGGPMIEKSLAFVRTLVDDANKRIAEN